MRVERVRLEHHGDAALGWIDIVHPRAADFEIAGGDVFQARDHPQQGGLAAAGGADEHHEFLGLDLEVHALDDLDMAIGLAHAR
jgi:hypothetical protein